MAYQRKMWKRFMKTILALLPNHISKYPTSNQIILNEFLYVLQHYEVDTQETRKKIFEHFNEFNDRYRTSEKLLTQPFLWFVNSYFTNASKLLSVASFHADDFYEYLVRQLRGDSTTKGVFQLIRESTPLADLKWEELQYACNRLSVPLTSEEVQALETIHTLSMETGIIALDQRNIKTNVFNRIKSPSLSKKFENLLLRLDSRWLLRFNTSAFDLELLFFHFQLDESTSLRDIIDFHDPSNTTLCNSSVYWVRGFHDMYCGILVVPAKFVERLQRYLQKCHSRAQLVLHELTKINTSQLSVSFHLYQVSKGWRTPTSTDWSRLVPMLKTKYPRKKRLKLTSYYLTPPFGEYKYDQDKLSNLIPIFCKAPRDFSFKELPIDSNKNQIQLSKTEIKILNELYLQKTLQVSFFSLGLIYEFSLDNYWIKLPKIPLNQLSRLLAWIPFSRLYFAEKDIYIWTYLTPELAQWMSTDLEWSIMQIIEDHNPRSFVTDWYAHETHQWKTPDVLKP
ncbi:MAG: hypothetical protein ACFFAE_13070 [Candidatus Hodarchaeota archaeon]